MIYIRTLVFEGEGHYYYWLAVPEGTKQALQQERKRLENLLARLPEEEPVALMGIRVEPAWLYPEHAFDDENVNVWVREAEALPEEVGLECELWIVLANRHYIEPGPYIRGQSKMWHSFSAQYPEDWGG